MMETLKELNKTYDAIQAFMHKFGRSPLIPGQQVELDQATGRSGHTVQYSEVRAEHVPFVGTKAEAYLKLFDTTNRSNKIRASYKNLIYFYNKTQLESIPETNFRSWFIRVSEEAQLLATNTNLYAGFPAADFISPMDAILPNKEDGIELPTPGQISNGYSVEIYHKIETGKFELLSPNVYNFDYFSGILTFNAYASDEEISKWKTDGIFISVYQYIGKKVLDYFKELDKLIATVKAESLAVQRIKFNSSDATPGETEIFDEFIDSKYLVKSKTRYVQNFTITIPGYCWELTIGEQPIESKYKSGNVFISDIKHDKNEEGKCISEIIFQLEILTEPEDIAQYGDKPIITWVNKFDDNGNFIGKYPLCNDFNLIAVTFTKFDGTSIEFLEDKNFIKENN